MDRTSEVLRETNNVVSSQGVFYDVFGQNGRRDQDPDGFYVGQGPVARMSVASSRATRRR